ncbi:MAG: hypothetical protein EBX40_01690 [Gammaproteobacteria bacterium]|nr:hypothetical protein [Gammaproteobacteria bacterium]
MSSTHSHRFPPPVNGFLIAPESLSPEDLPSFVKYSNDTKAIYLDLSSIELSWKDLEALRSLTHVSTLDLSNNDLCDLKPDGSPEDLSLLDSLLNLPTLKELSLRGNNLHGPAADLLMKAISNGITINLDSNPIMRLHEFKDQLEKTLSARREPGFSNALLKLISEPGVFHFSFKDSDIEKIVALLNAHPEITRLNLSHSHLTWNALTELGKLEYVRELDLSHNSISDVFYEGCPRDLEPFSRLISKLEKLDIRNNQIQGPCLSVVHKSGEGKTILYQPNLNLLSNRSSLLLAQASLPESSDRAATPTEPLLTAKKVGSETSMNTIGTYSSVSTTRLPSKSITSDRTDRSNSRSPDLEV